MNIQDILKMAKKEIASLDAEILLSFLLNQPREYLIAHFNKKIDQKIQKKYQKLVNRRKNYEPIAYIINKKEFYGLDFFVNKNVLIPRPETEKIVDLVIKNAPKNGFLLDIGTGSGCIPISILKNRADLKAGAVDISKKALKIAKKNAENHKINHKIKFIHSDLLKNINLNQKNPLIIVANLPYIPKNYQLMSDVVDYEPHKALFAGEDGLFFYKKLFNDLKKREINFDLLIFEADLRQKLFFKDFVSKNWRQKNIQFYENSRIGMIFA